MIDVKDLKYTYPKSETPTIKGIQFSIEKGEIFGFLGPSGAGKSTTQKILIKILSGFSGDAKVMNKSLNAWDGEFYENIGVGFELPNHYAKLTAIENLDFFSEFYRKKTRRPEELLEMVDLLGDKDKRIESFSKGMKMRLNFVRALMHDPQILFFDEPTSGLDPVNARKLKNIIIDLKRQGKTIFITTHNMYDADELCDRVAFIVDGKLTLTDTPHNLKLRNGKRKVKVEFGKRQAEFMEFDLDTIATNTEFLSILQTQEITSIHSQEATLEDIFIKTTGVKL
jgi:fluoroquinolone transport system ATP-binding protein